MLFENTIFFVIKNVFCIFFILKNKKLFLKIIIKQIICFLILVFSSSFLLFFKNQRQPLKLILNVKLYTWVVLWNLNYMKKINWDVFMVKRKEYLFQFCIKTCETFFSNTQYLQNQKSSFRLLIWHSVCYMQGLKYQ